MVLLYSVPHWFLPGWPAIIRRILFAPIALGMALAVLLPLLFVLQWVLPDLTPREALAVFGALMLCFAVVVVVVAEASHRRKLTDQSKSAEIAARLDRQAHRTIPQQGVLSGAGVQIRLDGDEDIHAPMYAFGKLFFDMMRDLASPADTPRALKTDWDATLRWLDTTREAIDQSHREQFARGYVAYLAEGVAPSPSLDDVFRRFKDPALARELCPELSDEMRGVYARMSRDPVAGLG